MTIELRGLAPSEWDQWHDVLELAFGGISKGGERREAIRALTDFERTVGAWDGDECVGTSGAFGFEVSVPGGALVRAAGVTGVSVASTHRRRGVLTSMMRRQLDDVRERGEPLAILIASEPAIYGRYGYGMANRHLKADIDTSRVTLAVPEGTDAVRLRRLAPADALPEIEAFYARQLGRRPGAIVRLPDWDRLQIFDDPASPSQAGASALQCVLAERDGRTAGYVLYRIRPSWVDAGPNGTVAVQDFLASGPEAYAALLRHLFGIDLTSTVSLDQRPVDDVWQHLVSDPRRCSPRVHDWLYARPVDVGAALSARAYRAPVDVVLDVEDAFCPWNTGRWRLSGDPKGASCERTTDPADLGLSVREVGGVYFGGVTLAELAEAGRVRELSPGALPAASLAFGSELAPWLPHGF